MEKDILSLKNIYRFLMVNDYPTYSEGVIREKNRKGLTLVKFWQDNLLYEFRSGKYGRMIWRNTGSRNRYLSEICNRSERMQFYREYMQEISSAVEQGVVLSQIRQFMSMLTERHFSWDVFVKKLEAVLLCFEEADSCYSEKIIFYFQSRVEKWKEYDAYGAEGRLFFASWYLTFLMLHALAGNCMGAVEMQYLREREDMDLAALWTLHRKKQETHRSKVHFLTVRNGEIGISALPSGRFFGREKELFDLKECLLTGGRYLLSGIGGIGKTELLRQLLLRCQEEGLSEEVVIIQYENNLAESMIQAFGQWHGMDLEGNFQECLAKIRRCKEKRIAIFIDNMNHTMQEDPGLKELLDLPGTIFITSRLIALEGFDTYPVEAPGREAGMLIFRDNYEKTLTKEDYYNLREIMDMEVWRHTLTVRLFGRAAKARKWSVEELKQQLEKKGLNFSWTEEDGIVQLQEVYRGIYSLTRLGRTKRSLLRILSLFPYKVYSLEFLKTYLTSFLSEGDSLEDELEELRRCGWLEGDGVGYAMHPFVAECMRSKGIREKDLGDLIDQIQKDWEKEWQVEYTQDDFNYEIGMYVRPEMLELAQIVMHAASFVEGRISGKLMQQILAANEILLESNAGETRIEFLKQILRRCSDVNDTIKITYLTLLCAKFAIEPATVEEEMKKQERKQTVSEMQYQAFSLAYGKLLLYKGLLLRAEEMAMRVLKGKNTLFCKSEAASIMAVIARDQGDGENYLKWTEKEVEYAKQDNKDHYLCFTLSNLCTTNLALQRFEEAKAALVQMEDRIAKMQDETLASQMTYYLSKGVLLMQTGEVKEGIHWLQKAKECAALYYGTRHIYYASVCRELAIALNRDLRREEALENYHTVLQIYETVQKGGFEIFLTHNNMGVLYLDWEKPEKGRKHLEQAYEIMKEAGGQPVAEVTNNLARACRMQGQTEDERRYLEIALPLLTQVYGEEYAKTAAARERLAELKEM